MAVQSLQDVQIRRLTPEDVRARAHELADILMDAVESGASVAFLPPLAPLAAIKWVLDVADGMRRFTHVYAAERQGEIVGMVQLIRAAAPNQPHRARVAKLLVHRKARGQGIGRALMAELESSARVMGITQLTLDTADNGDRRLLYDETGWCRAGSIPGYALGPDGAFRDAILYFKQLD